MQIKTSNIRFKNCNSQPCIAAHLQGTQSQHTEANLAKELQLPTHGKQLSIQQKKTKPYYNTQLSTRLKEIKEKRKNKGLRPQFFPFANSQVLNSEASIVLPL